MLKKTLHTTYTNTMHRKIPVCSIVAVGMFSMTLTTIAAFGAPEGGSDAQRLESSFQKVRPIEYRSEYAPHVGLFAGVADVNGGSVTNGSVLLDVGFQPAVALGLGAQIQFAPSHINTPFGEIDFNTTNILTKATYHLTGDIPVIRHSYFGAKTGLVLYNIEDNTDAHFAIGPTLGFDIPISPRDELSLGAEAAYLAVFGDNAPDQVSLLGAMKYWF